MSKRLQSSYTCYLRMQFRTDKCYEDKVYIWNDGIMPANLTSVEKLFQKHSSKPYYPKPADSMESERMEVWFFVRPVIDTCIYCMVNQKKIIRSLQMSEFMSEKLAVDIEKPDLAIQYCS